MAAALSSESLDQLLYEARTPNAWSYTPVAEDLIHQLYDLLKWGPTASNLCPARFVWVRSPEGKEQLSSCAMTPNKPKILAAPVTVIIGNELDLAPTVPKLVAPARVEIVLALLRDHAEITERTAMRNGSLQGAYLILAARALGLDCWPMSGFNNAAVDQAFFAGTQIKSNFLCGLGYANPEVVHPRGPRLTFDEAGRFA